MKSTSLTEMEDCSQKENASKDPRLAITVTTALTRSIEAHGYIMRL